MPTRAGRASGSSLQAGAMAAHAADPRARIPGARLRRVERADPSDVGIELPRPTSLGPGLYIGHFGGITISRHAKIGMRCSISQNVTIGVSGQGEKGGAPVIGDDVYIGPGARLFGKITIGDNAKIGANAVIHRDIPPN